MEKDDKSSKALNQVDLKEKIEIFSTEDDKIKSIGEILSNDSSRSVLKLLLDDTMTANQVAQKAGISLPLAIYHLKKMQDLGIIGIVARESDVKYYASTKFAFIITSTKASEMAKSSKSLFNSLKRIYRFAAIGFGGLVSWLVLQGTSPESSTGIRAPVSPSPTNAPALQTAVPATAPTILSPTHGPATLPPYMTPIEPSWFSHEVLVLVIPLVVIISGLVIERVLKAYKR
ncbi:MAG: winged helix-turn-helix transcriptional regulator [Thaumarchaeota archaeon]|nr:winged helix-turn-helix transcriptional regulator [Nitrososphaerota archaeon]